MSKFKINSVLTTNNFYKSEFKRIFGKEPKQKGGVVLDIYEDGSNSIYFFSKPDKHGNRDGLAEKFVEEVKS